MIDRLQDDTISGLVEVPAMFTKVFQICADYPPDDYLLLEGLFFNSIIFVGGHGVCMTADTQRYKRMPSYEVHIVTLSALLPAAPVITAMSPLVCVMLVSTLST